MIDRRPATRLGAAWILLVAASASGCSLGQNERDAQAQKLVQTLRADNARLQDSALSLKVQNQDLAQRAVDDSRSIQALETANRQYEQSIQNYQDDREEYRAAFRDLKGQVGPTSRP